MVGRNLLREGGRECGGDTCAKVSKKRGIFKKRSRLMHIMKP